jgi:hypothetical protein
MSLPPLDSPQWKSSFRAFAQGFKSVSATILAAVLFATYIGIGALAHDSHFSLLWTLLSTTLAGRGRHRLSLSPRSAPAPPSSSPRWR